MNITYDPNVDALYIEFGKGTFETVYDEAKAVALDYDVEGRLMGVEVLDASRHFGDLAILKHVTFKEYDVRQPPTPRPQVVQ